MSDPDAPDPAPGGPLDIDLEPTVAGRLARWTERARILRTGVEAARADHGSTSASRSSSATPRSAAAVPGALLVGAGLLFVSVFNVYVTTRPVEDRANTYGALGIAAALPLSLVLVGRVIVVSAELNASLEDRRKPNRK